MRLCHSEHQGYPLPSHLFIYDIVLKNQLMKRSNHSDSCKIELYLYVNLTSNSKIVFTILCGNIKYQETFLPTGGRAEGLHKSIVYFHIYRLMSYKAGHPTALVILH